MRWSVGIYVTWWRDQEPGPQLTRGIYHDHMRIASTYQEAEPANWGFPIALAGNTDLQISRGTGPLKSVLANGRIPIFNVPNRHIPYPGF